MTVYIICLVTGTLNATTSEKKSANQTHGHSVYIKEKATTGCQKIKETLYTINNTIQNSVIPPVTVFIQNKVMDTLFGGNHIRLGKIEYCKKCHNFHISDCNKCRNT
jgi:hypothetical protein